MSSISSITAIIIHSTTTHAASDDSGGGELGTRLGHCGYLKKGSAQTDILLAIMLMIGPSLSEHACAYWDISDFELGAVQ